MDIAALVALAVLILAAIVALWTKARPARPGMTDMERQAYWATIDDGKKR